MKHLDSSPLGRQVDFPEQVDPALLFAIDRSVQRAALGITDALPFHGADEWTAYELSWLDARGKPGVAIARFRIPADSPAIIESKSLKLYLNGFAMTRFPATEAVRERIADDLRRCCGSLVQVLLDAGSALDAMALHPLTGECIDDADVAIDCYGPPQPGVLHASGVIAEETLVSRLFRSNCPVTGQPDWADVQVRYRGSVIDRASLLRYLVSYRTHRDFHEQCVERIFLDIKHECSPAALMIHARFTRRGGLDINPWRSDATDFSPKCARTARQ